MMRTHPEYALKSKHVMHYCNLVCILNKSGPAILTPILWRRYVLLDMCTKQQTVGLLSQLATVLPVIVQP